MASPTKCFPGENEPGTASPVAENPGKMELADPQGIRCFVGAIEDIRI
jgi:hypothetical protein